jgi:hypothetical protein
MSLMATACGGESDDGGEPVSFEEISAIVDDLNAYWADADSDLGFEFEAVPRDRVGTGADGLTCDLAPIDSDEVAGNAFVDSGCEEGITVAYDPAYVGTSLAAAEATMAHEWGHVVQAQAGDLDLSEDPNGLPIDAELQADCFAGAWAAERAEANIERLRTDTAKAGDPDESDIEDPHAHGTPEQRVAAFDVGLAGGPVACIDELVDVLPE